MTTILVNTRQELIDVMLVKSVNAMDLLCDEIYNSLMDYVQHDIYDKPSGTYERTYEFKRSWRWENDDEGYQLFRKLFADEKIMTILWESNTGWYAHGNSRIRSAKGHPPGLRADSKTSTGNDLSIMAEILNNFYGDDSVYHDPYWDDFREEWTDQKIIFKFEKYLNE